MDAFGEMMVMGRWVGRLPWVRYGGGGGGGEGCFLYPLAVLDVSLFLSRLEGLLQLSQQLLGLPPLLVSDTETGSN